MDDASSAATHEVTALLDAWSAGDSSALDRLMPLVIDDLRRLAASFLGRQAPGHTLQPTALVNETYLRLMGRRTLSWENRNQFFAYAATVMRRILVNHARDRRAARRGGGAARVSLDEALGLLEGRVEGALPNEADLLDLDAALQELSALDSRQGRIVELRYFGGLSIEETADALGISPRTVKREWCSARLWLLRSLTASTLSSNSPRP